MVINGPNVSHPLYKYTLFKAVQDNSVSILWQIPQYVMITAAEILFSITGYEFAYSQAPLSMKALVQAFWLLTTAIGDSIIVGIAAANIFSNMAIQFLAYAGIMLVVIAIFAVMAHFYTYRYYNESGDVPDDYEDDEEELVDGVTQPYANDNRGYKKSIGETDSWDYRM
uniref:Peptide transporter 1 n=1 Tax=Acrobeloides nanus TaxID=290746 RepID=A0A914C4E3_9BILA